MAARLATHPISKKKPPRPSSPKPSFCAPNGRHNRFFSARLGSENVWCGSKKDRIGFNPDRSGANRPERGAAGASCDEGVAATTPHVFRSPTPARREKLPSRPWKDAAWSVVLGRCHTANSFTGKKSRSSRKKSLIFRLAWGLRV